MLLKNFLFREMTKIITLTFGGFETLQRLAFSLTLATQMPAYSFLTSHHIWEKDIQN